MSRIVLLGPPGAGKGTQGALLSAAMHVPSVSTGDLFREHLRRRTPLGRRVEAVVAAGEYVSDEVTTAMLQERLASPDARTGFLLDGYPRTAAQVDALDRMLDADDAALDAVVLLEVSEAALVERLLRRAAQDERTDDTPAVVEHRIELYRRETAPLVEHYSARGLLHRVDATGDRSVVHAALIEVLGRPPGLLENTVGPPDSSTAPSGK